jgi:hypothetical protein
MTSPTSTSQVSNVPAEYICPLTKIMMVNPLMSKTGHNFERDAILTWVSEQGTCPVTGKALLKSDLITNHALRIQIQFWCKNHGLVEKVTINDEDEESERVYQSLKSLTFRVSETQSDVYRKQMSALEHMGQFSLKDAAILSATSTSTSTSVTSDAAVATTTTSGAAATTTAAVKASDADALKWNRNRLSAQIAKALASI